MRERVFPRGIMECNPYKLWGYYRVGRSFRSVALAGLSFLRLRFLYHRMRFPRSSLLPTSERGKLVRSRIYLYTAKWRSISLAFVPIPAVAFAITTMVIYVPAYRSLVAVLKIKIHCSEVWTQVEEQLTSLLKGTSN